MTPYPISPIFKSDKGYKGEANSYLDSLTQKIIPEIIKEKNIIPEYFCISGYSLGGLFSIYSMFKTNIFTRFVSCSGSLWYPGFIHYVYNHKMIVNPSKIYLSLGDKEKNTKNKIISTVEAKTLELNKYFLSLDLTTKFEFNVGNHFQDANERVARGIKWIMESK